MFFEEFQKEVDFYISRMPSKYQGYVTRRFGFEDKGYKTLQEVGEYHDVTREYARIRIDKALESMRENFVSITSFIKDIKNYELIEKEQFSKVVEKIVCDVITSYDKQERYLDLLMALAGCAKKTYQNQGRYIHVDQSVSFNHLMEMRVKILDILNEIPENYSDVEIIKKLPAKFGDIPSNVVIKVIRSISQLKKDGEKYYVPIEKIKTYRACLYRALYERGTKTHWKDLIEEIKERTGRTTERTSASYFKHIDSIGRTGYWALNKWGVDCKDILDSITCMLKEAGKPLSPAEIAEKLKKVRGSINMNSLRTYLYGNYKNMFVKTEEGITVK